MKKPFLFSSGVFVLGLLCSLFLGAVLTPDWHILSRLRIPRTLLAIAAGGGLAVVGTCTQAVLGNPLADPYTLGVASAGTLGAIVFSQLLHWNDPWLLGLGAFLFSVGFLFFIFFWFKTAFFSSMEIILLGVISGFFFSSLSTLVLALTDPSNWTASLGWVLGSLQGFDMFNALFFLIASLFFSAILFFFWKPLDLLVVDPVLAQTSGVQVFRLRKMIFFISSMLTAVCIACSGVIGFVGLVVPHFLRILGVRTHLFLIPLGFISGAGLLMFSDSLARTVALPSEVPVGIITALFGAPIFFALLRRRF